jgi:hypothetical protein
MARDLPEQLSQEIDPLKLIHEALWGIVTDTCASIPPVGTGYGIFTSCWMVITPISAPSRPVAPRPAPG